MTMLPLTIANLIAVVLTFVFGTLFIRVGVRKIMIPFIVLAGLGCVGIALANGLDCFGGTSAGSYPFFFASLMVVRCSVPVFQMGCMMLITNWFIRLRGRMVSISCMGATLFTVVGTSVMPNVIAKSWGGDYRPFYYGVAVLCVIMAVILGLCLKDSPEDAGLFPDAADHAPISEEGATTSLKASEVLRDPIACALLFGVLIDKIGALKTEALFLICILIPTVTLMFMPSKKNVFLLVIFAVGLAFSIGPAPVTHPCVVSHLYGRRKYQSVNRITMALQMIPGAFSGILMTGLIGAGHAKLAYLILIILDVISFITLMTMMKIPDANAADRDTIQNKAG